MARKFGFTVKGEQEVDVWIRLAKKTPRTDLSALECVITAIAPLDKRVLKFLTAGTMLYDSIANRKISLADHSTSEE